MKTIIPVVLISILLSFVMHDILISKSDQKMPVVALYGDVPNWYEPGPKVFGGSTYGEYGAGGSIYEPTKFEWEVLIFPDTVKITINRIK